MISFDDFKKVEITAGKILSAEKVPEMDRLLKLMVDFGIRQNPSTPPKAQSTTISVLPLEKGELERDIRQIVSGIFAYFPDPQTLVGKVCMFVTNLEPRMIKGLESNGMLFAISTDDGRFSLLEPNGDIPEGTRAK